MKIAVAEKRNTGLAKVELHPSKPLVKVTLKVVDKEGTEEIKKFTLNKEDCPDYIRAGTFLVSMSADGKKMYSMRPSAGVFKFKVKDFVAPKDKEPVPQTKTSQGKGGSGAFSYQTFMVNFEIVDGENKGMVVPGSFSYNFQEGKDEVLGKGIQSVAEISHPTSKFTATLIELLEVTGVMKKQIPWKENLLPLLQKMMLKEDRIFSGSVKKGWIDSLFADESVDFE